MAFVTADELDDETGASPVSDFIIEQLAGPKRVLILRGRALPYRPVRWTNTQHESNDWYVGNPEASKQILGRRMDPTVIKGFWKDKFLGVSDTHPDAAIALVDGARVTTAEALAELVERMCDEGMPVRVTWARRVRVGLIKKCELPFDRRQDIQFEIEFSWSGDGTPQTPLSTPQSATASQDLHDNLEQAAAAIRNLTNVPVLQAVQGALDSTVAVLNVLATGIDGLGDAVSESLGRVTAPLHTIGHVIAAADRVVTSSRDVRADLEGKVWETLALGPEALGYLQYLDQRESMKGEALSVRALTLDARARISGKARAPVRQSVRANPGEDLRSIALRFLGSADAWTILADYNGLVGSVLIPGQLVLIPDTGVQQATSG